MKILIQIPCFNEELQIKNIIEEIRKSLDSNIYDYEIVIIDDGSTDRTIAIAKENGVKNIPFNHSSVHALIVFLYSIPNQSPPPCSC